MNEHEILEKLKELNRKYNHYEISSDEYHKEVGIILNEIGE